MVTNSMMHIILVARTTRKGPNESGRNSKMSFSRFVKDEWAFQ